jgi:hypothetical protein
VTAILVHAVAVHAIAGGRLAAAQAWHQAAIGAPNPPAQLPTGLAGPINTILGWGKGLVLVSGVAGLLICGGKMTIGHRNRASFAADGATGIPWVLGGLSLVAVSAGIVGVFL